MNKKLDTQFVERQFFRWIFQLLGSIRKSAGKDRPLGDAKYRAAAKFGTAEYSGEFPTSCWENNACQFVGYKRLLQNCG